MLKRSVLCLLLLGTCVTATAWAKGDAEEAEDAPAKSKYERPEPPKKFAELEAPDLKDEKRIEEGKEFYQVHCRACHGPEGKGDAPAGRVLNPPVDDLTKPALQDAMTDQYIYWRIVKGGAPLGYNGMTPFEEIIVEEEDVWAVVAYTRSLRQDDADDKSKEKAAEEVEILDDEAFQTLMEDDIKAAWASVRKAIREKDADAAAKHAKLLSEHAAKVPGCDRDVEVDADDDGAEKEAEKVRDQDDFKEWAAKLKEQTDEIAKQAAGKDWDKVDDARKEVANTCKGCHDVYRRQW